MNTMTTKDHILDILYLIKGKDALPFIVGLLWFYAIPLLILYLFS